MGTIVIGVDGSPTGDDALQWGVRHAERIGDDVVVIRVVEPPAAFVYGQMMVDTHVDPDALRTWAEEAMNEVLDLVRAQTSVPIEGRVIEGPPARSLCEAAEDAELLVIGSRGLGGFKGLLLGSVSHQVVTHARCPVVVVPHRED